MSNIQAMADNITSAASHPITIQVINQGAGIWKTGLITGLLTGGIALTGVWLTHRFTLDRELKKSKEAQRTELYYIATELVFILEEFAEGCAQVASDDGEPDEQREYSPSAKEPELSLSGISGNWRVVSPLIMYRIHALPILQNEARRHIAVEAEHSWAPLHTEGFQARQYHYAHLGLKALYLARRLRKEAGFPETRLNATEWSAQPVL